MATRMNPFWFVSMRGDPAPVMSLGQWGVYDELRRTRRSAGTFTGVIRVRLEALTPLHVGGKVETAGRAMSRRSFYRRLDRTGHVRPVIEGSTLRGSMRSYLEAVTNGWASSWIAEYPKERGDRHIGFWIGPGASREQFYTPRGERYRFGDASKVHEPAPSHVFPPMGTFGQRDGTDLSAVRVDPATVLFGLVASAGDEGKGEEETGPRPVPAVAGRVRFDDAWFSLDDVRTCHSLDLDMDAIMGGAKASKSNWWYFEPGEVRVRHVRHRRVAEFVGGALRGRKRFFHQRPGPCVEWYQQNWTHQRLRTVETECVGAGATSQRFDIHLEEVPKCLVELLLVALAPSCGVRHKIGALRPFGFGSVAFHVDSVLREPAGLDGLTAALEGDGLVVDEGLTNFAKAGQIDLDGSKDAFQQQQEARELALKAPDGKYLVDLKAWADVRLVSHWPARLDQPHRLFVYPPYRQRRQGEQISSVEQGFAYPVQECDVTSKGIRIPTRSGVGGIPEALWNHTRRAIDLAYYQMHADNYAAVLADSKL